MSKRNSGLFHGTVGDKAERKLASPVNGIDYNTAKSVSVKHVDVVLKVKNAHSVPLHSNPYSVLKNYKNEILVSERYYNARGDAYLDIDYTGHGNAKLHPNVPHEHKIHSKHSIFCYDGTSHF